MWWRHLRRPAAARCRSRSSAAPDQAAVAAEAPPPHVPVMAAEVSTLLQLPPGGSLLDMTFGAGGHTEYMLARTPDLKVYALDRDPAAHERARRLAAGRLGPGIVLPLLGRFSELPELLQQAGVSPGSLDGALIDAGCCSTQLEDPVRGFSVVRDGPLDMRMDGDRFPDQVTAAQVLEHASEEALARIIRAYGEEPMARRVARAVVEARYMLRPLRTTGDLARLVRGACQRLDRDAIGRPAHVATRTFQALRIFVNDELNELSFGVAAAHRFLRPAARLATLTFHSLEDRVVKEQLCTSFLAEEHARSPTLGRNAAALVPSDVTDDSQLVHAARKRWRRVNKKVVMATPEEVEANPRSRSAKLRVAEKCDDDHVAEDVEV